MKQIVTNTNDGLSDVSVADSVFTDFDSDRYIKWRNKKLSDLQAFDSSLCCVNLEDPCKLTQTEIDALLLQIEVRGFAQYTVVNRDEEFEATDLVELCRQIGLVRLNTNRCAYPDGVTRLQVDESGERKHYIPYTSRGLNWHTDGYYNETRQRIRAFALHCVRSAGQGGDSLLFDPELLYILMRDENPEWVRQMFQGDVLSIPENAVNEQNVREEQSGPVFWIDEASGGLQMRYTARTRSIRWRDDPLVAEAVAFIRETLNQSSYVQTYKLKTGEGVISNNCLHGRTPFEDAAGAESGRLLYRARYFDRINARSMVA